MCSHPGKAWLTGSKTENGKDDYIVRLSTAGDLLSLDSLRDSEYSRVKPGAPAIVLDGKSYLCDPIDIPCGKCVECRMEKAKTWKVRLCHEQELYPPSNVLFVTLTYDDVHLPMLDHPHQPYLSKRDLRDFLNRLRCRQYGEKHPFRFFACGEYGELGLRPHFHLILFLDEPLDDLIPYEFGSYHSATISEAWRHRGLIDVKYVEENMLAYVAGYVEKKQLDPNWDSYPVKPFLVMSRNLGSYKAETLTGSPDRKVYGKFGGHSAAIPRAYLRKCEDKPWFPAFKVRSREIAKKAKSTNLGVYKTVSQEKMGDLVEASLVKGLEKKRIAKL